MGRIIVFQHVPAEPLGYLDPLLREKKHRIRYVNFSRRDDSSISVQDYDALIVLGGPMNVTEIKQYPHLATELTLIKDALEHDMPILGICLGAQLIAHALGASVYPANEREIGWYSLSPTDAGKSDRLIQHFQSEEKIFQWHGQTFDLPKDTVLLVRGEACINQAYRYGDKVYGFQFHLEVDAALIQRWFAMDDFQSDLQKSSNSDFIQKIEGDTKSYLTHSLTLSRTVFNAFIDLLPSSSQNIVLPSRG